MSGDRRWYEDHENVCAFLRWMVEDARADAALILEILEKPWKWSPEYDEYLASYLAELEKEGRSE
jgi:hypothetical protein